MVTVALVLAIMFTESGFNPEAMSPAGAIGLMQVMPFHTQEDLYDPDTNVRTAVRVLSDFEREVVSVEELLAAYNGGYRQLNRLRSGQPLAQETADYIPRVLRRADLFSRLLGVCPQYAPIPQLDLVRKYVPRDETFPPVPAYAFDAQPGRKMNPARCASPLRFVGGGDG